MYSRLTSGLWFPINQNIERIRKISLPSDDGRAHESCQECHLRCWRRESVSISNFAELAVGNQEEKLHGLIDRLLVYL